jgi:hypothetical protein
MLDAVAKRISILNVRAVDGFWQGRALIQGTETLLTGELDATVYDEATAREAFVHVINVVNERSTLIRDAVASTLVTPYNALWRQGRTAKLTAAQIAKKLSFEQIHTSEPDLPSKLISIQLGASDMFGQHRIGCLLGWDGAPLIAPSVVA